MCCQHHPFPSHSTTSQDTNSEFPPFPLLPALRSLFHHRLLILTPGTPSTLPTIFLLRWKEKRRWHRVRCGADGARALTIIVGMFTAVYMFYKFRVKVRFTETGTMTDPEEDADQDDPREAELQALRKRVSDLEAAAAADAAPLPIGPRCTWTTPHGTRVHLLEDCAYLQRSKVKTMETCLYCLQRYNSGAT